MPLHNPITEPQIPQPIARDTEFQAADAAHINAVDPHLQYATQARGDARYLPLRPDHVEFGLATSNFLDFHVLPSSPSIDFDARLIVSEGTNQNGQAKVALQAGLFNMIGKLSVNGGVQVSRLLAFTTTVDLPSIAAGAAYEITINIPGAQVGDLLFFVPTNLADGLWVFNISAFISSVGVAKIYFHNLYSSAFNLAPFDAKLLVIGF